MKKTDFCLNFIKIMCRHPQATADIRGSKDYPEIRGRALFYTTAHGVLVSISLTGLPSGSSCDERVFGFHIHEGGSCTGNLQDEFANVGSHYNPKGCPHPYHSGDLPPLLSANTRAFSVSLTDRFTINEIVGRSIIVHSNPDDFTTQPAGNAGIKIACGRITRQFL